MLQTLVVGSGRAGTGLHLAVLSRVRQLASAAPLFATTPFVVCDPRFAPVRGDKPKPVRDNSKGNTSGESSDDDLGGTVLIDSIGQAVRLLDPKRTVVHVCTPPTVRMEIIEQLARNGFRKILVEKPLALDTDTLEQIEQARRHWDLQLVVVAQWLVSTLTLRLLDLVHGSALGKLQSLSFLQRKPRFSRSLRTQGHPTAFDVELPHSVGVALRLAGAAQLADAECTDMVVGGTIIPRLGSARLTLQHDSGVHTEIVSDLTSPVRERRIVLQFDRGLVIGHYPGSQDDDHAQLRIMMNSKPTIEKSTIEKSTIEKSTIEKPGYKNRWPEEQCHEEQCHSVFPDDALLAFLLRTYQRFHASEPDDADFALNVAGTRLLCAAKRLRASRRTELRP